MTTKECDVLDQKNVVFKSEETMLGEIQDARINRDNVRIASRVFKYARQYMLSCLDALERLHSEYAAKKGKPKLTKQFNALRKALDSLLAGLRETGF